MLWYLQFSSGSGEKCVYGCWGRGRKRKYGKILTIVYPHKEFMNVHFIFSANFIKFDIFQNSWRKVLIKLNSKIKRSLFCLTALGEIFNTVCHPLSTSLWIRKKLLTTGGELSHGVLGQWGWQQTGSRYEIFLQ